MDKDIEARFNAMDARFDTVMSKFDSIGVKFDAIDAKFDAMGDRFDTIFSRLDAIVHRLDEQDTGHDRLMAKVDRLSVLSRAGEDAMTSLDALSRRVAKLENSLRDQN